MTHTRTYEIRLTLEADALWQLPSPEEVLADLPEIVLDNYRRPVGLKASCTSLEATPSEDKA